MVRVEKCSFCGGPVWPGHGTAYVRNDCKMFRFCKSKCRKFWMKKKNPRKFRWTKAFRAANGKDLVVDKTFDFEVRRNRPVKYDRDLVARTLRTMRLVDEIRQQREAAHWERRMRTASVIETRQKIFDIAQNVNLVEKVPEVVREITQRAEQEIEENKNRLQEVKKQLEETTKQ